MTRARWHAGAAAVVLAWLAAAGVVAAAHRQIPASGWLMVHLLLLGAVSNAILVWSWHFTAAVLRLPAPRDRTGEIARLAVFNAGALTVVAGVLTGTHAVTGAGAALVLTAATLHVAVLVRAMRRALPSRLAVVVRYYATAAAFVVPVGALGYLLARGGAPPHGDPVAAHAAMGLLGWVGLPILGTLVTLWPTMLRTRMAADSERRAKQALPVLACGALATGAGLFVGAVPIAVAGLGLYAGGIAWLARSAVTEARQRPPASFAPRSTAAGVGWLAAGLIWFGVSVGVGSTADLGRITAALVVGGVLQVLLGAMTYLVPMVLGGGPFLVRARNARVDRWQTARLLATNLGLLVCVLPSPSTVRVTCSVVVLAGAAASAGLVASTIRMTRPAGVVESGGGAGSAEPAEGIEKPVERTRGVVAGLAVVVLAVVAGAAADPAAVGMASPSASDAAAGVTPTGDTTEVTLRVEGMRFTPASIPVPAGDRLVITVENTGDDVHDLVVETGQSTGRLQPGQTGAVDVGVVVRDLDGWCSIAGHRQMGMVLDIVVTGAPAATTVPAGTDAHANHGAPASGDEGSAPDLMAEPGPGFELYDPVLPPAPKARTHRVTLVVGEREVEAAPGYSQTRWAYNAKVPGPVLRGRVGDRFVITLVNDGTIGHSIDFHAGALAPDRPMRTIQPGERLTYRFTATRAGIWMYHCSTRPMSSHIANGMFGAVIIDPPDLPRVDREYLLVQSEGYLGPPGQTADDAAIAAGEPDLVVFNGYPMQYDHHPLRARAGERVRFWVLAAGPNRGSSFHIVGGQFDTVYREGGYDLRRGSGGAQALGLFPAQGGFVELTFPQRGNYPFVTHAMSDAERGAHGVVRVTP